MRINNVQIPSLVSALPQILPQEKKTDEQSHLCKTNFTDEPVLAQPISSNANEAKWTETISTTQPISSNSDFIQDQLIKKNALLMRIHNLEKPVNGAFKPIQTVLANTKPDKKSVLFASRFTEKPLLSKPLNSKSSVDAQATKMVSEPLLVQLKPDFSEPSLSATVDAQTTEMVSKPTLIQAVSNYSASLSAAADEAQTIEMMSEPTLTQAASKFLELSVNVQTTEIVSEPLLVQKASYYSESAIDAQITEMVSEPLLVQPKSDYSEPSSSAAIDAQTTEMVSEPTLINVEYTNIVSVPIPGILSKSIIKIKQKG